jgi:hypothetical protein
VPKKNKSKYSPEKDEIITSKSEFSAFLPGSLLKIF